MTGRDIYVEEFDEWRPIPGFDGYYVSATGRISGPGRHGKPRMLTPTPGAHGHMYVSLYKDGKRCKQYVHRLVAESFIPNPHHLPVVRHLNDCPDENHVDNLAWGQQLDNVMDMRKAGNDYILSDDDRNKAYVKRRTPVKATNLNTGEESVFISQQEAARHLGINQACISDIVRRKSGRHTTNGYTFEFIKESE